MNSDADSCPDLAGMKNDNAIRIVTNTVNQILFALFIFLSIA
jgi:hypothetical protein